MLQRVIAVVVLVCLLGLGLVASQWRDRPSKVSGVIEADEIRIGSRVGGRVARVFLEEGSTVRAPGTAIVELEPHDLNAREAEAVALVAACEARLKRLRHGFREEEVRQAQAKVAQMSATREEINRGPRQQEIDAAEARLKVAQALQIRARKEHDRALKLFEANGTVPESELDLTEQELRAAEGEITVRTRELELLQEGSRPEAIDRVEAALDEAKAAWDLVRRGARSEDIDEAEASVAQARAALDVVRAQKKELVIRTPTVGIIESLDLQPGDVVAPGAPVIAILDTSRLWVRAYVPEDIPLQLGQDVEISVNAYPNKKFAGAISYISRQAEFTPSNVQTPEESGKQVFRVKVTLRAGNKQLRAGMTAEVWLQPGRERP